MLLFPYARDVEYTDGELSLVLQFIDKENTTEIKMNIGLDEDLATMIEELMARV